MRLIKLTLACLAVLALFIAAAPGTCAATTANEVFICTFQDGKTMDDLMKVVDQWKPVIDGMKGGDSYSANILTPIASQNLASVIWVGQSPDAATLSGLTDQYEASKAGQDINAKFQSVINCESRSSWRVHEVK
jgi:hypothetical protein